MSRFQNKLYQIGLFLGDTVLFFCALVAAYALRRQDFSPTFDDVSILLHAFVPMWMFLVLSYFIATLYEVPSLMSTINRTKTIARLNTITLVFGLAIFYGFPDFFGVAPKSILILQITIFSFLGIMWRMYSSHHIKSKKKKKALLVGEGAIFSELKHAINTSPQSPVVFAEHIEVHSPLLGDSTLESLKTVLKENEITLLVVDVKNERVIPLLPYFYNLVSEGIRIYDIHRMYEDVFRRTPLSSIGYFWFFEHVTLDMRMYEIVKRIVDILAALPLLIGYAAVFPFIYLAIKLDDKGPIFSIQKRFGKGGKIIDIYKLRTMSFTDEGEWFLQNKTNKVTRVGKFLRKSRLDEFPQLWNVLKGDVSLVGPRTDILANGKKLALDIPFYMMRYSITPGLSGWAQVNQELPPNSLEETKMRLQYDLYYVKHRSLVLDLVIMFYTVRVLLMRTGI
jgi:lipopolysaccharide/colanic/teichoic acid biosynthesis glycosyltransferase